MVDDDGGLFDRNQALLRQALGFIDSCLPDDDFETIDQVPFALNYTQGAFIARASVSKRKRWGGATVRLFLDIEDIDQHGCPFGKLIVQLHPIGGQAKSNSAVKRTGTSSRGFTATDVREMLDMLGVGME